MLSVYVVDTVLNNRPIHRAGKVQGEGHSPCCYVSPCSLRVLTISSSQDHTVLTMYFSDKHAVLLKTQSKITHSSMRSAHLRRLYMLQNEQV